jgi:mycothiol synthase
MFGLGIIAIDRHGQGLGTALVEEIERRAGAMTDRAPAGRRVLMHMGALAGEPQVSALLRNRGYEEVRRFWRMGIEFDGWPAPPEQVEGIDIRAFEPGQESATYRCLAEAFEDHWGDGFSTEEEWIHRHIDAAEQYHPDQWFLAWSGDEVAGALIGRPQAVQDPSVGYIGALGVRRAYRGRGVGEALLRTSFTRLYEAGCGGALLHVDGDSPTGADRLYERVGMTAIPQFATWEKELRPGTEPG